MKIIQRLSKLLFSVLLTSIICAICTFAVMTMYIDMLLDQYQMKSSAFAVPSWSQFVAHVEKRAADYRLFGSSANTAGGQTVPASRPVSANKEKDTRNSTEEGGLSPQQQRQPQKSATKESPPEDAVAVFGQQSSTSNRSAGNGTAEPEAGVGSGSSTGSEAASENHSGNTEATDGNRRVVVTGEQFAKKKEQLSNEDKNKIFKLLMTRVPQNEIQTISHLMEDGITATELKEIERLLQSYLKPEEYSQLLSMIQVK